MQIEDFPLLILYSKDYKDGFHYEGKEDYESIKLWLTEMLASESLDDDIDVDLDDDDDDEVKKPKKGKKGKKTVEMHEDL